MKKEIEDKLLKLVRLIEYKLQNDVGSLSDKESDVAALDEVFRIYHRGLDGEMKPKHLSCANGIWNRFIGYITGSMPSEVENG
jgi:hypothetical protein